MAPYAEDCPNCGFTHIVDNRKLIKCHCGCSFETN